MKLTGFILIGIGIIGLLLNELVFDWGSVVTIILAAFNLVGFAMLAISHWVMRD